MTGSSIFRKKYRIVFAVLFLVIILAGSAFVVIFSVAKNQYWNNFHLQDAVLDLDEYDKNIVENDTKLDEIKVIVHECNEKAVPVRFEISVFFESCNKAIINYFYDAYGIDVTEKLHALQVMEASYPEDVSQMVGGSYSSDFPDKLFMNMAILDSFISDMGTGEVPEIINPEFSVKMLRTVYIHEIIHYLGFNSDSIFDHFTEAVAECLNKNIMLHSNIKYEGMTGYAAIQGFAGQIVECDPEFVRKVLNNGNSNMGEHFNNKLGNEFGINYAEYYDRLIGLIQKGDNKDLSKIAYYTQYLTYEYCKAVNSDARDILKTMKENNVSLFEIKWLFSVY